MEDWSKLRHVARLAPAPTGCLVKMRILGRRALFAGTMYDGFVPSPGGDARRYPLGPNCCR
jgi:hypothetical protein